MKSLPEVSLSDIDELFDDEKKTSLKEIDEIFKHIAFMEKNKGVAMPTIAAPVSTIQRSKPIPTEEEIDLIPPSEKFNTQLEPDDEKKFQYWLNETKSKYGVDLSKDLEVYDLRGYWKSGGSKDDAFRQRKGHAPDTFKKPTHPTFSEESIYHDTIDESGRKYEGGRWEGEKFIPPEKKPEQRLTQALEDIELAYPTIKPEPPEEPPRVFESLAENVKEPLLHEIARGIGKALDIGPRSILGGAQAGGRELEKVYQILEEQGITGVPEAVLRSALGITHGMFGTMMGTSPSGLAFLGTQETIPEVIPEAGPIMQKTMAPVSTTAELLGQMVGIPPSREELGGMTGAVKDIGDLFGMIYGFTKTHKRVSEAGKTKQELAFIDAQPKFEKARPEGAASEKADYLKEVEEWSAQFEKEFPNLYKRVQAKLRRNEPLTPGEKNVIDSFTRKMMRRQIPTTKETPVTDDEALELLQGITDAKGQRMYSDDQIARMSSGQRIYYASGGRQGSKELEKPKKAEGEVPEIVGREVVPTKPLEIEEPTPEKKVMFREGDVTTVKAGDLEGVSRKVDVDDLKSEIAKSGKVRPIEITKTGFIVDGYHRYQALIELGVEDIPVYVGEQMGKSGRLKVTYPGLMVGVKIPKIPTAPEEVKITEPIKTGDLHDWQLKRNKELEEAEKIINPEERIKSVDEIRDRYNKLRDPNWVTSDQRAASIIVDARDELFRTAPAVTPVLAKADVKAVEGWQEVPAFGEGKRFFKKGEGNNTRYVIFRDFDKRWDVKDSKLKKTLGTFNTPEEALQWAEEKYFTTPEEVKITEPIKAPPTKKGKKTTVKEPENIVESNVEEYQKRSTDIDTEYETAWDEIKKLTDDINKARSMKIVGGEGSEEPLKKQIDVLMKRRAEIMKQKGAMDQKIGETISKKLEEQAPELDDESHSTHIEKAFEWVENPALKGKKVSQVIDEYIDKEILKTKTPKPAASDQPEFKEPERIAGTEPAEIKIIKEPEKYKESEKLKVYDVPISMIRKDVDAFQNRSTEYSEESVNKILDDIEKGTFKYYNYDPIILWRNPDDGELYTFNHSRVEAFSRANESMSHMGEYSTIPAKIIEGVSKEEAILIAKRSNARATKELPIERAKYYRDLREQGKSEKEVEDEAKIYDGKASQGLINLSYLNPKGRTVEAIRMIGEEGGTANEMRDITEWIGYIRRITPDLTDIHESEMFDWLKTNYKDRGVGIKNRPQFVDTIERVTNVKEGFDYSKKLNLDTFIPRDKTAQEYFQKIEDAKLSLKVAEDAFVNKEKEFIARMDDPAVVDKALTPYREAVIVAKRDLMYLKDNKEKVLKELSDTELNLFDDINKLEERMRNEEYSETDIRGVEEGRITDTTPEGTPPEEAPPNTIPGKAGKAKKRVIKDSTYLDAKKRLDDKLIGNLSANPFADPESIADIIKIGAYHIESGVRKLDEFRAKMKVELGPFYDKLSNRIEEIFNRSIAYWKECYVLNDPEFSKSIDKSQIIDKNGVPVPINSDRFNKLFDERFKKLLSTPETKVQGNILGLNKVESDRIRKDVGLDQLEGEERRTWEETLGKAKESKQDEKALDVADEILSSKRPITDIEHAGMILKSGELMDKYNSEIADVSSLIEAGNDAGAQIARKRAEKIMQQLDRLTDATHSSRRETARALSIGRLMLNRADYSIAHIMQLAQAAKGEKLTAEETSRFEKLAASHADLESQLKKLEIKYEQSLAEQERLKAQRIVVRENNKANITRRATGIREKIIAERTEIKKQLAELGYRVNDVTGVTAEASYLIGKLAINYIKEGAITLDELVRKVLLDLPGITDRDILQAINAKDPNIQLRARSATIERIAKLKTMARLNLQIEDATNGIFGEKGKKSPQPDEIRSLQKQLSQLRSQAYQSGILPDRLENAIKKINELQDQLDNHYRSVKKHQPITFEELTKAREKIKELQKTMRIDDELANLNEQLRSGEFVIKGKPTPKPVSPELEHKQIEVKRAKDRIFRNVEALKPIGMRKIVGETANTLRTLKATADFSATLRQGIVLFARQPKVGASSFAKSVHSFFSSYKAEQIDNAIRSSPNQYLRDKAKLELSELEGLPNAREEYFAAQLIEKIPVLGSIIRASNRHMTTFLNLMRSAAFDQFLETNPNATHAELSAWADFINVASGRGNLGRFKGVAIELSLAAFAPRFAASRFQTPLKLLQYWKEPRVRKEISKTMGSFVGMGLTALVLAKLSGAKVGVDHRDPDFGKIVIGDTHIDIWGGFQQPARLITRIALAATDKIGLTGKDLAESDKSFSPIDAVGRFAAFKLAPAITIPNELLSGKTMVGEKVTLLETAANMLVPMVYQDMYDGFKLGGVGRAAWSGGLGALGVGISTYQHKGMEIMSESVQSIYRKLNDLETINNTVNRMIRDNKGSELNQYMKGHEADYRYYIKNQKEINRFKDLILLVRDRQLEMMKDNDPDRIEKAKDMDLKLTGIGQRFDESYKAGHNFTVGSALSNIRLKHKKEEKKEKHDIRRFKQKYKNPQFQQ